MISCSGVNSYRSRKVLLRNADGYFLSFRAGDWEFSSDRSRAAVFDYVGDHIEEQIEILRRTCGLALDPISVDPKEIFETCDGCSQMLASFEVFFDGRHFLCPACRAQVSASMGLSPA